MDLAVRQQVGLVAEAAATLGARVRLLARVDAPVRGQVGLIGEALPALGALVRALARVHAAVSDQVGLVAEALTTAGTLERAVAHPTPGWVPAAFGCRLMGRRTSPRANEAAGVNGTHPSLRQTAEP